MDTVWWEEIKVEALKNELLINLPLKGSISGWEIVRCNAMAPALLASSLS
jgi:hypothetical protein